MKGIIIYILLFSAVIIAVLLHGAKIHQQQDDIDKMGVTLHKLDSILPVNSNISLKIINPKGDVYFWSRYVLAPRFVSLKYENNVYDTVLTIQDASLKDTIPTNRKLLWKNSDGQNNYLLTSSN
ncbi:MAG TPA: hypothetical protein VN721_09675 [Flavipsychrobacter sp.]|nr:hypothetical protein [Flavipsychrobacter sp.]